MGEQFRRNLKTMNEQKEKAPKKSSTTILCELTRLKSQQKYLECSQVKLNPENFTDDTGDGGVQATLREIENVKIALDMRLDEQMLAAKRDVDNMWLFVNAMREDLFDPQRLNKFTVKSIEERILMINSMLSKMAGRNLKMLHEAQEEQHKLECDLKLLV